VSATRTDLVNRLAEARRAGDLADLRQTIAEVEAAGFSDVFDHFDFDPHLARPFALRIVPALPKPKRPPIQPEVLIVPITKGTPMAARPRPNAEEPQDLDPDQKESAKKIALKFLANADTPEKDKALCREFLKSIGMGPDEIGEVESGGRHVAKAFGATRAGGIRHTGVSGRTLELGHMTRAEARAFLAQRGAR
jgi:hypothetical protein